MFFMIEKREMRERRKKDNIGNKLMFLNCPSCQLGDSVQQQKSFNMFYWRRSWQIELLIQMDIKSGYDF